MSTSTMTLLFATLAVLAGLAAVVLIALRMLPLARGRAAAAELLAGQEIPLAFVVALVATLGSLYFSEVAHFVPCRLCWYQRIAMYPLPVILGIAWATRDERVRRYVLPLASIGGCISIYHILVERFPSLESSRVCDPTIPCTIRWVERFGFVTIPVMALCGFALIVGLLVYPPRRWASHDAAADTDDIAVHEDDADDDPPGPDVRHAAAAPHDEAAATPLSALATETKR
jgi:disulfide bond formation protein DsbB